MSGSDAGPWTIGFTWSDMQLLVRRHDGLVAIALMLDDPYEWSLREGLCGRRYISADVTEETATICVSDQPERPDALRLPDHPGDAKAVAADFTALALVRLMELHGVQGLADIKAELQDGLRTIGTDPPDPLDDADEEGGT